MGDVMARKCCKRKCKCNKRCGKKCEKCCTVPDSEYGATAKKRFPTVVDGSVCASRTSTGTAFDFDTPTNVGTFTQAPDGSFTTDTTTGTAGIVSTARSVRTIVAGKGGRLDLLVRPRFMTTSQVILAFQDVNRAVSSGFSGAEGVLLRANGEISYDPYYGPSATKSQLPPCVKLSVVSDGSRIWVESDDEEIYTYPVGHDPEMYAYIGFVSSDPAEVFDIKLTVNP